MAIRTPASGITTETPLSEIPASFYDDITIGNFGDDVKYWSRYIFHAAVVMVVESVGVLAYLLLSPTLPHRLVLEVITLSVTAAMIATLPLIHLVARREWRTKFSFGLALGSGFVLAVCCALNGGLDSRLLFLLALPVANVAIAFPPRSVVLCSGAAVVEFAVVAMFDSDVTLSAGNVVLVSVFLFGMIALALGWSFARSNLDQQRNDLFVESVRNAKIDTLTGCLNHGAFFERLQTEIDRALRYDEPLSLLMADVDVFKSFNDRLGHPAGDHALTTIGAAMTRCARNIDIVGRIGGDEFAVILPATDLSGASDAAERMAKALHHPRGIDLTVSVGYAALDRSEPAAKRLFRDADAGLYNAKVTGRDRASGPLRVRGVASDSLVESIRPEVWAAADTRRFEQAVREARTETSEALAILRTLELSDSMGIAFVDTDYRIVRINPTLAAINGGTVEDLLGTTVAEHVPELWPALEPIYRSVIETGEPSVGLEISRVSPTEPGVTESWLTTFYPVTADGVRTGLCVVALDITARKQLENRQVTFAESAVRALAGAAEMRDPYTGGHQSRVAEIAAAVASELEIAPEHAKDMVLAAMIHDVGKLAIPAEILSRPGRLSVAEMALVREHSRAGAEMLERVGFPDSVRLMVLQHHERLDGTGYPDALKGDEILMGSRIIAVADVLEAMSSHRPYRAGLGIDAAVAEIQAGSGSRYDSAVVATCVRMISEGRFHQLLPDERVGQHRRPRPPGTA